jgi:hypothetical protein
MGRVLIKLGRCLVCGGHGKEWLPNVNKVCGRCDGSGKDPSRHKQWYVDLVLPLQLKDSEL